MANAYQADVDILTANDDGRATAPRRLLVIHTFEGRGDITADSMARYQQSPAAGGSYHMVIDVNGRVARENDDDYIPWSAMATGNRIGFHFSLAGQAAYSRDQWLARTKQLDTLARVLATYSRAYSIPLTMLTTDQVRAGLRGVCGHAHISGAFHESDHTDPGQHFPYDVVLSRAHTATSQMKGAPMTTPAETAAIDARAQLTGSTDLTKWPGWPQLGDRTVVDALAAIGAKLGVDGFKDTHQ